MKRFLSIAAVLSLLCAFAQGALLASDTALRIRRDDSQTESMAWVELSIPSGPFALVGPYLSTNVVQEGEKTVVKSIDLGSNAVTGADLQLVIEKTDTDFFALSMRVIPTTESIDISQLYFPPVTVGVANSDGDWLDAHSLKAVGTGGLSAIDGHTGSFFFLKIANPENNQGVVSGWEKNHVGAGIFFSGYDTSGNAQITPMIEYGKKPLASGSVFETERVLIGSFADAREGLEKYADQVAKAHSLKLKAPRTGFCSWSSDVHPFASDENATAEFALAAQEKLVPYGMDFYQIDDMWQDGHSENGPHKNFSQVRTGENATYPSGMRLTADRLEAAGLDCGIWLLPFSGTVDDPCFAGKKDLFIKSAETYTTPIIKGNKGYRDLQQTEGEPYVTEWAEDCLDGTNPKAVDHIEKIFRRMVQEWHITYFKIDGLWAGFGTEDHYVHDAYEPDDMGRQVFFDPEKSNVEAYCAGMEAVRRGATDDSFILGCNVAQNMLMLLPSVGYVDAMRIGPDNYPWWERMMWSPWRATNRYFLNGRVWWNDPDQIYVRDAVPYEQSRAIASWAALTGQLYAFADWLPGLSDQRLNLIRKTIPVHGLTTVRPADYFTEATPRIWTLSNTKEGQAPEDTRYVVGLFNWDTENAADFDLTLQRLGLPEKASDGTPLLYATYDFWNEQFEKEISATQNLCASVPTTDCKIIGLRPILAKNGHPVLLSTSRNVTQGIYEVTDESWNDTAKSLTVVINAKQAVLSGPLPYTLVIAAPEGFNLPKGYIGNQSIDVNTLGDGEYSLTVPAVEGAEEVTVMIQF